MIYRNKIICILIANAILLGIQAQKFPMFSQYMFNGLVVNPAYSGTREVLSVSTFYRNQWVGTNGAPEYQSFSAHAPVKNQKVGLGLLLLNEQVGSFNNTHLYFNYSYLVRKKDAVFAIGLKGGVNFIDHDYKNIQTNKPDQAFEKFTPGSLLPNFGIGIYYRAKKYFTGFSIPYLLTYTQDQEGYAIGQDLNKYDFLFTGGYLLQINQLVKLKPSLLVKYNIDYNIQTDLNLHAILLKANLWVGLAYRIEEALVSCIEYQINPQLRLGYAYDYTLANASYLRYSSHEFSLRYELSYRLKASNPRYF